mgnify:CR=1 FL=1
MASQRELEQRMLAYLQLPGARLTHNEAVELFDCTYNISRHVLNKLARGGLVRVSNSQYPAIFSMDGSRGPNEAEWPDRTGRALQEIWPSVVSEERRKALPPSEFGSISPNTPPPSCPARTTSPSTWRLRPGAMS